jgi:hypothetical protein
VAELKANFQGSLRAAAQSLVFFVSATREMLRKLSMTHVPGDGDLPGSQLKTSLVPRPKKIREAKASLKSFY